MAVNNEYVNRVDANGQTLIDLTNDTAEAEDVLEGQTFHLRSGAPATGTYKPSAEIEARLKATVGHSGKNQLSYGPQNLTTTVSGVTFTVDSTAGTVTANGTSTSSSGSRYGILLTGDKYNRVLNYPARSIPNGKYYFCGCPAGGSTNDASYNVYIIDLNSGTRAKRWNGTASVATDYGAENKNELLINDQSHSLVFNCRVYDTNGQNIIFRPMVWSGDIPDDSFEPYVTPTDEKKQDKPIVLWEAALNSTGVSEVAISSLADDVSNYSYLKVVVTNELGTMITDQTVVQTDVEYDLSYIGQDVVRSTGSMLGIHEVNGKLVFDRLFIWVLSDSTNIIVIGLRDHDDSIGPPDTVPGLFIRRIIGIPK